MWTRTPMWLVRVLPGRVLMARPCDEFRTLEGLASVVWAVLDEPGTAQEVIDRIVELLPAATGSGRDLDTTLELLEEQDVIERLCNPADPT